MDNEEQESSKGKFLTAQNIITLIIGLLSISISLYIYLSSRKSLNLKIEQISPITYASTKNIRGINQFELIVNGEKLKNLIAIPFKITNTGDEAVNSKGSSRIINIVEPIKIKIDFGADTSAKIITIQKPVEESNIEVSYVKSLDNVYLCDINLSYLNPGDFVTFSILINSPSIPQIDIVNNPIIGGKIIFSRNNKRVVKKDLWYLFKYKYFLNFLSIIFMVQFPFIFFYLIYQARILYLDNKNDEIDDYFDIREKEKKEQQEKISSKIDAMINENISDKSFISRIKNEHLPIPKGGILGDKESLAKISIFDLLKSAYTEEWRWILENEFPLDVDRNKESKKTYFPQWIDWEDYIKFGVLFLGLGSLILFILGYFLYFK